MIDNYENEIWRDIYFWQDGIEYDYRGLYQVSNYGRVKSFHNGKEKILKLDNYNGYDRTDLCKNGKCKRFKVHRLVAHMFLSDSYFNGAQIDHVDTNPLNNHASNLRWCTGKENSNNPLTKKHYSEVNKGKTFSEETKRKLSEANKGESVAQIDPITNKIVNLKHNRWYMKLGFTQQNISSCCRGKRKTHKGYIWKYISDCTKEQLKEYYESH